MPIDLMFYILVTAAIISLRYLLLIHIIGRYNYDLPRWTTKNLSGGLFPIGGRKRKATSKRADFQHRHVLS